MVEAGEYTVPICSFFLSSQGTINAIVYSNFESVNVISKMCCGQDNQIMLSNMWRTTASSMVRRSFDSQILGRRASTATVVLKYINNNDAEGSDNSVGKRSISKDSIISKKSSVVVPVDIEVNEETESISSLRIARDSATLLSSTTKKIDYFEEHHIEVDYIFETDFDDNNESISS